MLWMQALLRTHVRAIFQVWELRLIIMQKDYVMVTTGTGATTPFRSRIGDELTVFGDISN